MRNDHLFLHRLGHRLAVLAALALTALPLAARADVNAVPPPNQVNPATSQQTIASTPNRSGIQIHPNGTITGGLKGTNISATGSVSTGIKLSIPPNHFGGSTNTSGTIHGVKTNPVHGVDSYGNRATGQIKTSTNVGTTSSIGKAGTTLLTATLASAIVNSPGAKTAAQQLALGNYGHAAAGAVAALDVTGLGSGVYGLIDIYQNTAAMQGMRNEIKDAAEAKANAAAAAAQAAADAAANGTYQQFMPDPKTGLPQLYPTIIRWWGGTNGTFLVPPGVSANWSGSTYGVITHSVLGLKVGTPNCNSATQCQKTYIDTVRVNAQNYNQHKDLIAQAVANAAPKPTLEDFLLSNLELQNLIASYLDRNLAQNEALATAITNMLWQSGQLNPGNTQTVVMGTPSENTFITAPYTPAGSNQAQQTQFVVNPNGTVTTSYIPRPDLGAHTSQAPTRSLVGGNKGGSTGSTGTTTGGSTGTGGTTTTPKLPDDEDGNVEICDQDDEGKIVCLEAGSDDYEDLAPATDEQRLEFRKQTPFSTNGRCPADAQFQFLGHTFSFSYYAVCRIAELVSPMIELLGIATAAAIAYGAVREL